MAKERRIIPVTFTENDLALLNELEELAHADGRVISDVIRRALRFWATSEDAQLMRRSAKSASESMLKLNIKVSPRTKKEE